MPKHSKKENRRNTEGDGSKNLSLPHWNQDKISKSQSPVAKTSSRQQDLNSALEMNRALRAHEEYSNYELLNCQNPLLNVLVLDCIYGNLGVEDIKKCRLICRQWNSTAEPLLYKMARIAMCPSNSEFSNFRETFLDSGIIIPFGALRLAEFKDKSNKWNAIKLTTLFTEWKQNLMELTIDKIELRGKDNEPFDLTSYLNELSLAKLTVHCFRERLKLSFKVVTGVTHLRLRGCYLEIMNGDRLSPVDIEISSCIFAYQSNELRLINSFVDFQKTKRASFEARVRSFNSPVSPTLVLDMNGDFSVDYLKLRHMNIINSKTSNWKILHFHFSKIFDVSSGGRDDVENDVSVCVPQSVQKLSCKYTKLSEDCFLPDLTHAIISYRECDNIVPVLRCTSLISLEFYQRERKFFETVSPLLQQCNIPFVNWIPKSVKNISIKGKFGSHLLQGLQNWNLDKFVVKNSSMSAINKDLLSYKAKEIVVQLRDEYGRDEDDESDEEESELEESDEDKSEEEFEIDESESDESESESDEDVDRCSRFPVKLLRKSTVNFSIGKFDEVQNDVFLSSALSKRVDKMSEYYSFKRKKGTGITKTQFEKLLEF